MPSYGHTAYAVANLINATCFAEEAGKPLNTTFSVRWRRLLPKAEHSEIAEANTAFLNRMKNWYRRRELPCAYAYIMEKNRYAGLHTHYLLHVPEGYRHLFDRPQMCRWLAPGVEVTGDSFCWEGRLWGRMPHQSNRCGKLTYLLKGTLEVQGTKEREIIRAIGVNTEFQGVIDGKRSGVSTSIGKSHRQRTGWPELDTADELAAAMDALNARKMNRKMAHAIRQTFGEKTTQSNAHSSMWHARITSALYLRSKRLSDDIGHGANPEVAASFGASNAHHKAFRPQADPSG